MKCQFFPPIFLLFASGPSSCCLSLQSDPFSPLDVTEEEEEEERHDPETGQKGIVLNPQVFMAFFRFNTASIFIMTMNM